MRRKVIGAAALLFAGAGYSRALAQSTTKVTGDDFIEIQQLYANYARAIDLGEGEKFAATFIEGGEFTAGRGPGRGGTIRPGPPSRRAARPWRRSGRRGR